VDNTKYLIETKRIPKDKGRQLNRVYVMDNCRFIKVDVFRNLAIIINSRNMHEGQGPRKEIKEQIT